MTYHSDLKSETDLYNNVLINWKWPVKFVGVHIPHVVVTNPCGGKSQSMLVKWVPNTWGIILWSREKHGFRCEVFFYSIFVHYSVENQILYDSDRWKSYGIIELCRLQYSNHTESCQLPKSGFSCVKCKSSSDLVMWPRSLLGIKKVMTE